MSDSAGISRYDYRKLQKSKKRPNDVAHVDLLKQDSTLKHVHNRFMRLQILKYVQAHDSDDNGEFQACCKYLLTKVQHRWLSTSPMMQKFDKAARNECRRRLTQLANEGRSKNTTDDIMFAEMERSLSANLDKISAVRTHQDYFLEPDTTYHDYKTSLTHMSETYPLIQKGFYSIKDITGSVIAILPVPYVGTDSVGHVILLQNLKDALERMYSELQYSSVDTEGTIIAVYRVAK